MPDFYVTQEKIRALLEELRTWEQDEQRYNLDQLARKFGLDLFVIDRVARSEGLRLPREEMEETGFGPDPNATTLDLDPDEIQEALSQPESDPNYPDVDTGVWRKNPTGEWKRIGPGQTQDEEDD